MFAYVNLCYFPDLLQLVTTRFTKYAQNTQFNYNSKRMLIYFLVSILLEQILLDLLVLLTKRMMTFLLKSNCILILISCWKPNVTNILDHQ